MIIISGVMNIDTDLYDEIWYITNNVPKMRLEAQQHSELAPSREDYNRYRSSQNIFTRASREI